LNIYKKLELLFLYFILIIDYPIIRRVNMNKKELLELLHQLEQEKLELETLKSKNKEDLLNCKNEISNKVIRYYEKDTKELTFRTYKPTIEEKEIYYDRYKNHPLINHGEFDLKELVTFQHYYLCLDQDRDFYTSVFGWDLLSINFYTFDDKYKHLMKYNGQYYPNKCKNELVKENGQYPSKHIIRITPTSLYRNEEYSSLDITINNQLQPYYRASKQIFNNDSFRPDFYGNSELSWKLARKYAHMCDDFIAFVQYLKSIGVDKPSAEHYDVFFMKKFGVHIDIPAKSRILIPNNLVSDV